MLHRCIEGEKVGVDGTKIVDVDRLPDRCPGYTPAPPEARGREPPPSSSSFTFSLDGRTVSPMVHGLHGMGGERAPPRLDLSLCLSLFLCSPSAALSPFLLYPKISNSDSGESFAQIFLIKLAFLQRKKSVNRLKGGPRECQERSGGWARPLSHGHLGNCIALILPPKNHKYSKIILRPFLSRLDSV